MLNVETASGANSNSTQIAKFDGFHKWRPFHRITYFDVIEIALHSAYGQKAGERIRMPTLMPVMYALARFGNLPYINRPNASSSSMAVAMASAVRVKLSSSPNEIWPTSR